MKRPTRTLPIVGVLGSGEREDTEESKAVPLGRWLAGQSVHLLTGGGAGVMESVSRAFSEVDERSGLIIGVLKGQEGVRDADPNPYVELPIYTHLPLSGEDGMNSRSRNHINVLTSDVLVALRGGDGTASEVALAVEYSRPVIAFVDSRDEIPNGVLRSVEISGNIEEIKRFVDANLKRIGARSA